MGTIANKLDKIKNTKDKIKTVTNLSTVNTITSETIFKDYPKQILKEYVKIINNGTDELYTNFPKVEDEGTKLELDTEKGPLKMILEGNTSQNEEPTPDMSVPIKVVTNEQNIKIRSKNLINLYSHTNTLDNKTTILSANTYECNSTAVWQGQIDLKITDFKKNTRYIFSVDSSVSNRFIVTYIAGVKDGVSTNLVANQYKPYLPAKFNTAEYDEIRIRMWARGNGGSNGKYTIKNIQLEEGTTVTNFEPYYESQTYPLSLGNIELARINNYKDCIFKNEVNSPYYNADLDLNDWYKYTKINKWSPTGTESWMNDYGTNLFTTLRTPFFTNRFIIGYGLSNYYKYNSVQSGLNNNLANGEFTIQEDSMRPFFKNTLFNNSTDFKADLQEKYNNGNPVIIRYPLETPIYEKITDTTLIQQLENIKDNAKSYLGTTIIECSSLIEDNETVRVSATALEHIN